MRNFLFMLIVLISVSCGRKDTADCHHSYKFQNRSTQGVYVINGIDYPDTTSFSGGFSKASDFVNSNSKEEFLFWEIDCKEFDFKYQRIKNDTLIMFVVAQDIAETKTKEEIQNNNLYLQRYYLSLPDLRQLNFTISYPPDESMKDVAMYPPYLAVQ